MASDWDEDLLSNIAEVIDSRHKTPVYSESGYPMVRVVDINGGALNISDTKKVSQEVYEDFSRGRDPQVGDLVISRVGSYGVVSYVNSNEKFCLGQNTAFIIPKINSRFLYYQLISPFVKWQIEQFVVGAVQKTISLKSIRQFQIKVPPIAEQKAIAHILGTLDDKIQLNRKMNETLEAMAQALFKSWFVDFDPVIDNALAAGKPIPDELMDRAEQRQAVLDSGKTNLAIRDLFPDEFEFTEEMGWIPKGWESVKLIDLLEVKYGKDHKKLEEGNIPVYGSGGLMRLVNKSLYKGESILIPRKGTLSNLMFVDEEFWTVDTMFFSIPKFNHTAKYLFQQLKLLDFSSMNVGSAVPSMTTKVLNDLNILKPQDSLLEGFDKLATDFFTRGQALSGQNKSLAGLRNALLPKLLSGELRIPDA